MKFRASISLFLAASLYACTSENIVGTGEARPDVSAVDEQQGRGEEQPREAVIGFDGFGAYSASSRAQGGEAAALLGGQFRVYATFNDGLTQKLIDNYQVNWLDEEDTFGNPPKTWAYLGYVSKADIPVAQATKYWNNSVLRYDFVAFAGLSDSQRIRSTEKNTFALDKESAQRIFYGNRVSAKRNKEAAVPGVSPEFIPYGDPVKFTFRRATASLRVGFYETIPGYSVKDLRFYYDDNADAPRGTSAKTVAGLQGLFPEKGEYTITYDNDNTAHADFADGGTAASHRAFGTLDYKDGFIGTSAAYVTFALSDETIDGKAVANSQWHPILPYENNTRTLTIKVDYTLVSDDNSKEEIKVSGAQAVVPLTHCRWKPNYSYTYVFKINTQAGYTNPDDAPEGLYPITFDATVSDIQESMTHEEEIKKVH